MRIKTLLTFTALMVMSSVSYSKTLYLGVSLDNFDQNYQAILRKSMEKEISTEGGIKAQFEDAKGDTSKQMQQVQDFIAQGVDGLVLVATDTQAMKPIVKAAADAKIPLVFVTRRPEITLPENMSWVGSDPSLAGKMQMDALASAMKNKGNISILMGTLSSEDTRERTKSVEKVISEHPELKIQDKQSAQYYRKEALDITSDWMLSGKPIDAIAANNDEMAIGAIMAIKQAGKSNILVAGIDGTPDALQFIKSGDMALTIYQDAITQGSTGIKTVVDIINGKPYESKVLIPYELITKDNLADFIARHKN